jgi:hypothetical protein
VTGGPGDALDQGYAAGVAKLRAGASNVQFIGYVPTGYTKRDAALVNADIDAYATWKASYLVDGIFLDEVSPDQPAFYKLYANKIKGIEWSSGSAGMVMLNPGAPITDDAYYAYADQIMLFEQSYAHWLETKPCVRSVVWRKRLKPTAAPSPNRPRPPSSSIRSATCRLCHRSWRVCRAWRRSISRTSTSRRRTS